MWGSMLASNRELCGCRDVLRADASIRPYNGGKAAPPPISPRIFPNFSKNVAKTTHKILPIWYNILSRVKRTRLSIT